MNVLVLGDSTAFHGPTQAELLTHPKLFPNVLARLLDADVVTQARLGWTARDAWWALTRDPYLYSVLLPNADVLVLALGGMDHLPAAIPTYLRTGLDYLRPGSVRRRVKKAFHLANPHLVRLTNGRMRALPQRATLHYLDRIVDVVRHLHPGIRIVGIVPPPFDAEYFGHVTRTHAPAVEAHRAWGRRRNVPLVDLHAIVRPHLEAGDMNPDGMHWSWATHEEAAAAFAAVIRNT